jgi:exonuclease III
MDMRFGTWNVRSLYRRGSLKIETHESAKYNLDLLKVQEVRWDNGDSEPADNHTFFYGNRNANHHIETGFFVHKGIR